MEAPSPTHSAYLSLSASQFVHPLSSISHCAPTWSHCACMLIASHHAHALQSHPPGTLRILRVMSRILHMQPQPAANSGKPLYSVKYIMHPVPPSLHPPHLPSPAIHLVNPLSFAQTPVHPVNPVPPASHPAHQPSSASPLANAPPALRPTHLPSPVVPLVQAPSPAQHLVQIVQPASRPTYPPSPPVHPANPLSQAQHLVLLSYLPCASTVTCHDPAITMYMQPRMCRARCIHPNLPDTCQSHQLHHQPACLAHLP